MGSAVLTLMRGEDPMVTIPEGVENPFVWKQAGLFTVIQTSEGAIS